MKRHRAMLFFSGVVIGVAIIPPCHPTDVYMAFVAGAVGVIAWFSISK